MTDIFDYIMYTINIIANSYFSNKFVLKGGSVLIARMIEHNRKDLYRMTSDIDIHCDSSDLWVHFRDNVENLLNNNGDGVHYTLLRSRALEKGLVDSDSLLFEVTHGDKHAKFKIDMNIKSNNTITVEYSPYLKMNTYGPYTMLADKIVAVSSRVVYRRAKDLYDIFVLASLYNFRYSCIMRSISVKHPRATLTNMLCDDESIKNIEHAYSLYEGILYRPTILDLIGVNRIFLEPIYYGCDHDLVWNNKMALWQFVDQTSI